MFDESFRFLQDKFNDFFTRLFIGGFHTEYRDHYLFYEDNEDNNTIIQHLINIYSDVGNCINIDDYKIYPDRFSCYVLLTDSLLIHIGSLFDDRLPHVFKCLKIKNGSEEGLKLFQQNYRKQYNVYKQMCVPLIIDKESSILKIQNKIMDGCKIFVFYEVLNERCLEYLSCLKSLLANYNITVSVGNEIREASASESIDYMILCDDELKSVKISSILKRVNIYKCAIISFNN